MAKNIKIKDEYDEIEEKENIINWWYNSKIASKLCWGLKKQSFGRGYLPRVDWSHPWTDAEILKELGLPEDFLSVALNINKKTCISSDKTS